MPLSLKKETSSAVPPATAKLTPWLKLASLSKYGLTKGSLRDKAEKKAQKLRLSAHATINI